MNPTHLSNIEAILNICANLTEIVGVRYGVGFIVAAALIAFIKKWRVARNYLLIAIGSLMCGFAMPGAMNWAVATIRDAQAQDLLLLLAVLCGVIALAVLVVGIGLLYLPVHIAKKRQKKRIGWIIGLSALSILFGILWSIALFLAHRDDKQELSQNETISPAAPDNR